MLKSLLYVSRSRLASEKSSAEVEEIVRQAQARNEQAGITGALIFTESNFAQVIEGENAAIDRLVASIMLDRRHTDVRIIRDCEIEERLFGGWWMAYAGPSFYVNRHIKPLLADEINEGDRGPRAERLISLMHEFTSSR